MDKEPDKAYYESLLAFLDKMPNVTGYARVLDDDFGAISKHTYVVEYKGLETPDVVAYLKAVRDDDLKYLISNSLSDGLEKKILLDKTVELFRRHLETGEEVEIKDEKLYKSYKSLEGYYDWFVVKKNKTGEGVLFKNLDDLLTLVYADMERFYDVLLEIND
jgi:hypothetical protein